MKKWEKSFEDVFDKSDEINKFLSSDFDIDKFCKLTDSNFKLNKCNYLILGKPFQNYQISKISKKLENTNLFCDEFTINHGSKAENPVNKITFFLNDSIFKLMN